MIRVLVAEDSAAVRMLLVSLLSLDSEIEVVGEASTGAETIRLAERLRPDVITMDIHMPGMNGIEATETIMSRFPTPIVMVSSAVREQDVAASLEATSVGALTAIPKPDDPHSKLFQSRVELLITTVKAMSQVKVVRRWSRERRMKTASDKSHSSANDEKGRVSKTRDTANSATVASRRTSIPIQVIAIGASTGGPAALQQILSGLPKSFPLPIVIVQHIAEGFIGAFAHWLSNSCALRIRVAADGDVITPGTVYLAPHGSHIGVTVRHQIFLSSQSALGGFRPSASYLFSSAASVYGSAAVGVILTGMGHDGIDGLRDLRAAGGRILAQDEASCVVYGMPQEAVKAGVVDEVVPLSDMSRVLMGLGTTS